jgi:hypothetical protein
VGAALAPGGDGKRTAATVTAAAKRPVINAPDNAGTPPALAHVTQRRKHRTAAEKKQATAQPAASVQQSASVAGTVVQQTQSQPSSGGTTRHTTTTQQTQSPKQPAGSGSPEPPAFDEHSTSGQ